MYRIIKRPLIGAVMHEFRTNRMLTDRDSTSNGRLCPFCPLEIFEHAQNFLSNGIDIAVQGTVSPDKKRT